MSRKHWWEENPKPEFDYLYQGLKEEDARIGRDFSTYRGELDDSGGERLISLLEAPFCALGMGIVISGFLVYLSLCLIRGGVGLFMDQRPSFALPKFDDTTANRSGPHRLDSLAAILRWIPRLIMLPKVPL